MYNNFAFTKNIVALTIFNIAYNTKKKQTTKNCIIKIVSININRAKIAIFFLIVFVLIQSRFRQTT